MRIAHCTSLLAIAALTLTACGGEAAVEEADEVTETDDASTAAKPDETEKPEGDAASDEVDAAGKPEEAAPTTGDEAPAKTEAGTDIDFGDDSGDWSNDDECDDPRFEGPGMTTTTLLDSDIRADATDCREAFERGELTLRQ